MWGMRTCMSDGSSHHAADQKDAEISSCKDQIVSLVKSQGTSEVPKEEKKPRTLEEIANDTLNGGK